MNDEMDIEKMYGQDGDIGPNPRISVLERDLAIAQRDLAAAQAERDALRAAWETAKRQNSHDMLLSGDEIHQHNEAIWIAGGRK